MREEMGLARSIHCNAIRLWIEFTAWMADPDKVAANLFDAIAAIDENGMKAMPCLSTAGTIQTGTTAGRIWKMYLQNCPAS